MECLETTVRGSILNNVHDPFRTDGTTNDKSPLIILLRMNRKNGKKQNHRQTFKENNFHAYLIVLLKLFEINSIMH